MDAERGRVILSADPLNAETPLASQFGTITPVGSHYVRSHFAMPSAPQRLLVDGLVREALALSFEELCAMPSCSTVVTLECAGNGRSFLDPPVPGEQWALGAVGTAEWTGVPLRELLRRADVLPEAREVVARGADEGAPKGAGGKLAFERSLPVADALREGPLVAYAMNGAPLPAEHGAPFRLVVPGAYGMASVKWLARLTAVAAPFAGYFQRDRYVVDGAPLPPIAPRAIVVAPADGAHLAAGRSLLRGYAWSGGAPIAAVEVSTDGGAAWRDADLADPLSPYAWREWQLAWDAPRGEHSVVARAVTSTGERQPLDQRRTELGYINNAARATRVTVG